MMINQVRSDLRFCSPSRKKGQSAMTFVWYAGLLDLALTAAHMHHAAASAKALFLLRNLALAAENKVHFVTNPRALPILLAAAARAGHNAETGAYAASALWALVHQGEKVSPLAPVCTLSINQSIKSIYAPVMNCHRLAGSAWTLFILLAALCTSNVITNQARCHAPGEMHDTWLHVQT